jgi:peptidoglycan LD-endopeptidase LytH
MIMKFRLLLLIPLLTLVACESARSLRQAVRGATPHERYVDALRDAGLHESALGQRWIEAGERALLVRGAAPLPLHEISLVSAEEPAAVAHRFRVPRGQRVHIAVAVHAAESARVFLDLFEQPADTTERPRRVMAADDGELALEYEPRRDAELILRVQPELLRTVRIVVDIRTDATLAFPVHGRDMRAVGSRFGSARDGGRREHHGIDIFAPRGTPVLAASDGIVRRVGSNRLGGNVIWLTDSERGLSHYYAHLDTQLVAAGARVRVGDTLGLVGNTGNARTTPPHLHYGLYAGRGGPVDPWNFLYRSSATPARLTADTSALGGWWRSRSQQVNLREAPSETAPLAARLSQHTPLRVVGATGAWLRVELPDGGGGYIASRLTEPTSQPIVRRRLAAGGEVLDRPSPGAVLLDSLAAGATVPVLARFGSYLMVDSGQGRIGWLAE